MKRTLDILIALIAMVGIAVIVDFAAHRPIYEELLLLAVWLVMIAAGAIFEIVEIVAGRTAERKASRLAQVQPMWSDAFNPEQSSPRLAA